MPLPAGRPRRDLTDGSIASAIWALALPMMLGNVIRTTFSLVDMFFLGKLESEAALSAVGMSAAALMLLFTVFMGIATAATAMVARAIGEKNQARADRVAAQSLLLTVTAAIVVGVAGFALTPFLLGALGAEGEALEAGTGYMRIFFLGIVPALSLFVSAGVLRGAGDAWTPLVVSVIGGALNVVLDPLLIFGYLGFPRLGVRGAAVASVIGFLVAFLLVLRALCSGRTRVRLRLRDFRPDPAILGRLVAIGIPNTVQMSLRALMGLVLVGIVQKGFGDAATAAFTVGRRLQGLGFMPTFGIAAAAATLVGQNLGAGKPDRARRSALAATAMALAVMGGFAVVSVVLAPRLIGAFLDTADVVRIGAGFLRIAAPGLLFAAVGIVLSRSIAGAGDTVPPMVITLVGLWAIQVPLAYYLSGLPSLGVTGVWIANLTASLALMTMTTAYFCSGRWKHKRV